jgi:hypothetical protein
MAKKDFFLLADTETTQDNLVADFGAIICDRQGNVVNQIAVMVDGIFTDKEKHPLFFDSKLGSDALWSRSGADRRYDVYNRMIASGSRMIASVNAINNWLAKAAIAYSPVLTAYNLPFDMGKCINTGIDLTVFDRSFDLMAVAQQAMIKNKKFLTFCLENHLFNNPTKLGNMTVQMKAETVGNFLSGMVEVEPHTSLEDVMFFELPILIHVLKHTSLRKILDLQMKGISWQNRQVKDLYKVR